MSTAVEAAPRPLPDAVVGMGIFLAAEAMLFAGLVSATVVLRAGQAGAMAWMARPEGLPVAVGVANIAVLLLSGAGAAQAWRERRSARRTAGYLVGAIALGCVFLAVQAGEWAHAIGQGFTGTSGVFGATFGLVVGTHALHVVSGLAALAVALVGLCRAGCVRGAMLPATAMYWGFVVAVWPVLYAVLFRA